MWSLRDRSVGKQMPEKSLRYIGSAKPIKSHKGTIGSKVYMRRTQIRNQICVCVTRPNSESRAKRCSF